MQSRREPSTAGPSWRWQAAVSGNSTLTSRHPRGQGGPGQRFPRREAGPCSEQNTLLPGPGKPSRCTEQGELSIAHPSRLEAPMHTVPIHQGPFASAATPPLFCRESGPPPARAPEPQLFIYLPHTQLSEGFPQGLLLPPGLAVSAAEKWS